MHEKKSPFHSFEEGGEGGGLEYSIENIYIFLFIMNFYIRFHMFLSVYL